MHVRICKRMNIRKELWLQESDGRTIKPKASFTRSRKKKELFRRTLHDVKAPIGNSLRFKHLLNLHNLEIKASSHMIIMS